MSKQSQKPLKVAIVMPTHAHLHSSLHNLLKVYDHLITSGACEITIFTDARHELSFKQIKVEKIHGLDFETIWAKGLFVLGLPRFFYTDLVEKLKGYDVIESSNPEFYGFAYQAYKAAKRYHKTLIYRTSQTVDGFFLFKISKFLVCPFMKHTYTFATSCLFTNPQAFERAQRLGLLPTNEKAVITGHATDTTMFIPKAKKQSRTKTLLSVGGLYHVKGHHLIIDALSILHKQGLDVQLNIVGKGQYEAALRARAKHQEVEDRVHFLGALDHKQLVKAYQEADVFVLANLQEITPAVNEAVSCEVPVVVMECGGREFVLPNEDYAEITQKEDTEQLAIGIKRVIQDPKKAKLKAQKARRRVAAQFSITQVAKKMYEAWNSKPKT